MVPLGEMVSCLVAQGVELVTYSRSHKAVPASPSASVEDGGAATA